MGIVLLRRRVLRSCLGTKEILREGEIWRTDAQIIAQFFSFTPFEMIYRDFESHKD